MRMVGPTDGFPFWRVEEIRGDIVHMFGLDLRPLEPPTRPLSDRERATLEEKADLDALQSAAITDLRERLERVEAHLWPPTEEDDPDPDGLRTVSGHLSAEDAVAPREVVLGPDGKRYRNATLFPLKHGPDIFPQGYRVLGTVPGEWVPWVKVYGPDDPDGHPQTVVTSQGRTYRARQTHTTQPGWEPRLAPALWEDVGPAAAAKRAR